MTPSSSTPVQAALSTSQSTSFSADGVQHQHKGRPAPRRHGKDVEASRRMSSRLRLMIRGRPDPDAARWEALGQALWRGDPLADELMTWMQTKGMAKTWPQFERALKDPASVNGETPAALRAFILSTQGWPEWVNADQMRLGARVLQATGLHGMMVLRDAGLMAGYQASGINQTLVMTGALHKGAQRRVAETTAWWLACTEDGGMAPGAEGFTMTLRVRLMHAMVRHQLCRNPQWDADELGLPVNQVDMQATYLAFSVVQLLSLKTTGVWLTARESEAVMHLWRYIGWLMGVEDGLLCDDEHTGRIMLYQNTVSQAPADETSVLLGRALMDEPLHRHYANWKTVRGRFNKARHLSLVRWFVGPEGMHALGLPTTIPWYPLAVMAPFALRTLVLHAVPGLMAPWTKWARTRQRNYLTVLMGDRGRPPHLTGSGPGSKGQAS